jgi:hypothetical protein
VPGTCCASLGSKGVTPNAISPTHAEGGVLYQALKSGRNFAGKKAEIFVDAMFCDPCGKNNGLSQYLNALGLDELIVNIRLANGHVVQGLYNIKKGD